MQDLISRSALRHFLSAQEGLAAAEFAMFAPILVALYFGVTELTDGFTASTKVTSVASTAADLPAQEQQICDAEMNDMFAALRSVIFPYPDQPLKVVISSLVDSGNGVVKVAWSNALNASPRAVGSTVTVPNGLVASGGSVILAEVSYDYSSPTGHLIYGSVRLSDKFYAHPRRVAQVQRTVSNC